MNDNSLVIGFDGTMIRDCAKYLPIISQNNQIFKYSPLKSEFSNYLYTRKEIEALAKQGNITLLKSDESIPFSPPEIVLFLSNSFLSAFEEKILIQAKNLTIDEGRIFLLTEEKINLFLNDSAETLMEKASNEMIQFFKDTSKQNLKKTAELYINLARQSAISKSLRAKIFIRYGMIATYSLQPEKLENVFRLRMVKEFPNWTWESFQTNVNSLIKMYLHQIKNTPEPKFETIEIENEPAILQNKETKYNSEMLRVVNRNLAQIIGTSRDLILQLCVKLASDFRAEYSIDNNEIKVVGDLLLYQSNIRLDNNNLKVLSGEPEFYYLMSLAQNHRILKTLRSDLTNSFPFIDTVIYQDVVKRLIKHQISGDVTKYILRKEQQVASK